MGTIPCSKAASAPGGRRPGGRPRWRVTLDPCVSWSRHATTRLPARPRRHPGRQRLPALRPVRRRWRPAGSKLSVWRIHRRMALAAGCSWQPRPARPASLSCERPLRGASPRRPYPRRATGLRLLPRPPSLLARLRRAKVPWAIPPAGIEAARPAPWSCWGPPGPGWAPQPGRPGQARPRRFLAAAPIWRTNPRTRSVVGDSVWTPCPARPARRSASACCRAATAATSWSWGWGLPGLRGPGRPAPAPRRGRDQGPGRRPVT